MIGVDRRLPSKTMDVTPQVINEVEFHQKMRGYDPDEVDDFLERVAVAVEQMQDRVREVEQRAVVAERRAAELTDRLESGPAPALDPAVAPVRPTASETDETETIRRTLVLAQRTADAAIKEAEEEAHRTLQTAQDQVQRLYAEAQDQARKLVVDAEAEARKTSDDTRQRLVKEIITLEETRDALRADQGILERHLDEQRLRLRSSIGELQRLLDDPGRLRQVTSPELSGVTLPDFVEESAIAAPADDVAPTADAAPAVEAPDAPADDDAAVIDLGSSDSPDDDVNPFDRPRSGSVTFMPPDENDGPNASPEGETNASRVAVADDVDVDPWVRFARGDLDGPPTMDVRATDAPGDAYLTELRKAMLEDTSASTLEPGEERARPRFGRRR